MPRITNEQREAIVREAVAKRDAFLSENRPMISETTTTAGGEGGIEGFTPGPWQWYWRHEDGVANCGVFAEPRKGMAYSVCRAPRYEEQAKWEANARLIALAPTLYAENATLRAANKRLEEACRDALDAGNDGDWQSAAKTLRAALSTGKTE